MDPLINLKRPSPVSHNLCIICQKDNKDELRDSIDQGLKRIEIVTSTRRKLRDYKYHDAIDRIENAFTSGFTSSLVWHRNCYAQYTDKGKIERLQNEFQRQGCSTEASTSADTGKRSMPGRKSVTPMDWNQCLFCQTSSQKQRIISVMTLKKSQEILQAAGFDRNLSVRLAGVNDLIAAEGKYHLACYSGFSKSVAKAKKGSKDIDIAMAWLCNELQHFADKGCVRELSTVWDRYCILAGEANVTIPQSYVSRRSSFKESLIAHTGDVFDFIVLPDRTVTNDRCLLFPSKYKHVPLSEMPVAESDDDLLKIPVFKPDSDIFMSLVHVALKLRGDILAHPGHTGFDISDEKAAACVPDSLYMFLRLLYEGPSVLDSEPDSTDVIPERMKVLSVGQDMVFGVSDGKKWTPKHIGLGSTLHQATRSKKLLQLFHSAGHTISYESVLKLHISCRKYTLNYASSDWCCHST